MVLFLNEWSSFLLFVSYLYPRMTHFLLHFHRAYFVDAHVHQDLNFHYGLIALQVVELRYFLDFQYFVMIPFLNKLFFLFSCIDQKQETIFII